MRACPRLHGRCDTCGNRGHIAEECNPANEAFLRGRFEAAADQGLYTKLRGSNPHWGYYKLDAVLNPVETPFSYDELVQLPTATVPMALGAISQAVRSKDPLGLESGADVAEGGQD